MVAPLIRAPETGMKEECPDRRAVCDWSAITFTELERLVKEQVPDSKFRQSALDRIAPRLDPTKPLVGEDEMAAAWVNLERAYDNSTFYLPNSVVDDWQKISCAADGAPYVARGLLLRIASFTSFTHPSSKQKHDFATALLDEKNCPGALGLSSIEKSRLKKLRDDPG